MKLHDDFLNDDFPWDVKRVNIDLGGDDDEYIEAMVFCDRAFSIAIRKIDALRSENEITVDGMHIDVARRLRDFLNYSVKD